MTIYTAKKKIIVHDTPTGKKKVREKYVSVDHDGNVLSKGTVACKQPRYIETGDYCGN